MLVVLAILGIVLAAIAQLFTSGLIVRSRTRRTARRPSSTHGSGSTSSAARSTARARSRRRSGYPASAVTVTLGSYCQATGGATTVTWCTKDRNGATPPVASAQPYTLWRYVGSTLFGHRDALGVEPRGRSERHRRQDLRRELPPGRDAHPGGDRHASVGNLFVRRHGGSSGGAEVPGVVSTPITAANAVTAQLVGLLRARRRTTCTAATATSGCSGTSRRAPRSSTPARPGSRQTR